MADDKSWRKLFESEDVRKKLDLKRVLGLTKSLHHTKADLEKLLSVAIAEIEFLPKDGDEMKSVFCTGNVRFVNAYKRAKPADKQKQLRTPFVGMHTNDPFSVDVYDVEERRQKTVSLKSWKVVFPFVLPITEDNVLVLDGLVNRYLRK